MKIYEVRDITCDETYYAKGFYSSYEKALAIVSSEDAWGLAYEAEDCVILALYEWEVDAICEPKKVYEIQFSKDYSEETDEEKWVHKITSVGQPTPREIKGGGK